MDPRAHAPCPPSHHPFLRWSQRITSEGWVSDPSFTGLVGDRDTDTSRGPLKPRSAPPGGPDPAASPLRAPGLQRDVTVEQPVVLGVRGLLRAAGRGLSRERVVSRGRAGVAPRSEVAPVQGVDGGRMVLVGGVGV